MRLAAVVHRIGRVEAASGRRPPERARGRLDLSYATVEELRELIQLTPPEGERPTTPDGRAAEIVRAIEERIASGERPPGGKPGRFAGIAAPVSRGAHGTPEMIAKGCDCAACVPPAADFEARRRSGKLTEANVDGSFAAHIAPGVSVRLGFDPTAKPDMSRAEDGPAAGSRPPVGLAAKARAESSVPAPAPAVEPEPPAQATVDEPAPPSTDWRASPYDDSSGRIWRSQRRRDREAASAGLDERVF